ncbi:hypothetical protein CL619_00275 [archaeon]|nr:hypothetical protein [archaeon]
MVRGISARILKVARLQEYKLVSRSALFDAERKIAKSLRQDVQREMTDEQLDALQTKRSKEIYTLRTRLKKSLTGEPKTTEIKSLEKKSIQKMRKYENELRKQLKKISQTIKDSHNLILYEQQQATHDVAAALTFLTHFIHVIEINLSDGELSKYIPDQFRLRLTILLDEAIKQLTAIEKAAIEAIQSEFSIHKSVLNRAKSKASNPQDLADLVQNRARANKRLHGRIGHLKSVLKDIHNTLVQVMALAKSEPKGIFLPEISLLSTHASVNITLLHDSIQTAVRAWPLSKESQQSIRKEADQVHSQLYDIQISLQSRIKQREEDTKAHAKKIAGKLLHDWSKLAVAVETKQIAVSIKKGNKLILEIAKKMLRTDMDTKQMAECLRLMNQYLQKYHNPLQTAIQALSKKTVKEGKSPKDTAHKFELFRKFTKAIETFQSKTFYFYRQLHQRLKNTTDIITSSLTIQQQLATTLVSIQKHLKELYLELRKEHEGIAALEHVSKNHTKSKHHNNFVKELITKEQALEQEIETLQGTIGKQVKHLIAELPEDQLVDQTHAAASVRELERELAALTTSANHAVVLLGATAAK